MKNYLRAARMELKDDYINASCASMIYYVALFLLVHMAIFLPVNPVLRGIIVFITSIILLIPLSYGYVNFFKTRELGNFPSPKRLYTFPKNFLPLTICQLIIVLISVLFLGVFIYVGIAVCFFVPGYARIYVLGFFVVLWLLSLVYIDTRFWPLYFLAQEYENERFVFFLKECLAITKKRKWDYLRVCLRFWRLFVVCILPLGLGLLIFFPLFVTAKQHYFNDLTKKSPENQENV